MILKMMDRESLEKIQFKTFIIWINSENRIMLKVFLFGLLCLFYPRYFCVRVCVIILGDDANNARLCKLSFSATQFPSTCLRVNRSLRVTKFRCKNQIWVVESVGSWCNLAAHSVKKKWRNQIGAKWLIVFVFNFC